MVMLLHKNNKDIGNAKHNCLLAGVRIRGNFL